MSELRRFRKKASPAITAVQVNLDTNGFTYRKWGDTVLCKPGDWIIDNQGDVYTVHRQTFENTYRPVGPGVYAKAMPVWAEVAKADGVISTKEGRSHYKVGDYLVFNDSNRSDGYAVSAVKFEEMYELDEDVGEYDAPPDPVPPRR